MDCKCYRDERNFLGKVGVCLGTKECEACLCGGDESKCDFYEDKREKATQKTTNGDHIRAMTDEELAEWIDTVQDDAMCYGMHDAESYYPIGTRNWLAWLEQEAME